jgi:hypothetical protein
MQQEAEASEDGANIVARAAELFKKGSAAADARAPPAGTDTQAQLQRFIEVRGAGHVEAEALSASLIPFSI